MGYGIEGSETLTQTQSRGRASPAPLLVMTQEEKSWQATDRHHKEFLASAQPTTET